MPLRALLKGEGRCAPPWTCCICPVASLTPRQTHRAALPSVALCSSVWNARCRRCLLNSNTSPRTRPLTAALWMSGPWRSPGNGIPLQSAEKQQQTVVGPQGGGRGRGATTPAERIRIPRSREPVHKPGGGMWPGQAQSSTEAGHRQPGHRQWAAWAMCLLGDGWCFQACCEL